jgi:phosphatidylserine decarboxylase
VSGQPSSIARAQQNNSKGEWFVALQRVLPQHFLSRVGAWLAESEILWLKNWLIRRFINTYGINLQEAASENLGDYKNFNQFFTRALKPEARPINDDKISIVCPADGAVSQIGTITDGEIFQAKGQSFAVDTLLGADQQESAPFINGSFTTIYLSPRDYHRVHMPIDGELMYCRYIPGQLFSVNNVTAQRVNGLFARNERLVCMFDTPAGRCAMILVGAMMVAGIETVWHGHFDAHRYRQIDYSNAGNSIALEKGEEMGRFKFGSTVILLFEDGAINWGDIYKPGSITRMGEALATLRNN